MSAQMTVGRSMIFVRATFVGLCLTLGGLALAQNVTGRYVGELIWRPLDDGRQMQLVQPFGFIDKDGLDWPVPAGTKVDGASIPQVLWSIAGSPFTGKYRNASVIHDHYCVLKTRPSKETHNVFYEAMIASGEDANRAKLMYYAVLRFGPRWEEKIDPHASTALKTRRVYTALYEEDDFEDFKIRLEKGEISDEEIEVEAARGRRGKEKLLCREPAHSPQSMRCTGVR